MQNSFSKASLERTRGFEEETMKVRILIRKATAVLLSTMILLCFASCQTRPSIEGMPTIDAMIAEGEAFALDYLSEQGFRYEDYVSKAGWGSPSETRQDGSCVWKQKGLDGKISLSFDSSGTLERVAIDRPTVYTLEELGIQAESYVFHYSSDYFVLEMKATGKTVDRVWCQDSFFGEFLIPYVEYSDDTVRVLRYVGYRYWHIPYPDVIVAIYLPSLQPYDELVERLRSKLIYIDVSPKGIGGFLGFSKRYAVYLQ